jgi:hypothetical protein
MLNKIGLHPGANRHQYGAMDFKLKLVRLLEETKLPNVAELARRAAVAKTSCYRWFDPEDPALPDVKEALRVAKALEVSLDYLADDQLDERPVPEYDHDEREIIRAVRELRLSYGEVLRRLAMTGAGTVIVTKDKSEREDPEAKRG